MRAQEAQIELQKQQAAAAEAQAKKAQGIDLAYVDPSSGGRYGAADIARTLGGGVPVDPQAAANYEAEAADQQNSRKLNRGLAPDMYGYDDEVSPGVYPHANGLASNAMVIPEETTEEVQDDNVSEDTISEMLGPVMNPTTGGISANNGITGANSPLTQGTI
jgi:hypothetical protein